VALCLINEEEVSVGERRETSAREGQNTRKEAWTSSGLERHGGG